MFHSHITPPVCEISTWSGKDMACALLQRQELGGVGLHFDTVRKLVRYLHIDGAALIRNTLEEFDEDETKFMKKHLALINNWLKKQEPNSKVQIEIDCFQWFLITRDVECIDHNNFIEKVLERMKVPEFDETLYSDIVMKQNEHTNECLGEMASRKVDFPYILYKNTPKLDWRFSTEILKSKSESISIHEDVASRVRSGLNKIIVLLALSGAGKTHTLFYLNTSNTSFTLSIDFGSIEDISILLKEPLDYIKAQVSMMKENMELDERAANLNEKRANNIKAEIEALFALRAFMLLKFLNSRKNENLSPSLWIRYLYTSAGYETFTELYHQWIIYFRILCLQPKSFLQTILVNVSG